MSIEISGVSNVLKALDSVIDDEKIEAGIGKACALIERSARQKAPKGNGDLRRSITSKVDGLKGEIFTPLEYAPYVEFGTGLFAEKGGRKDVPWHYKDDEGHWHSTRGQKPQPFMRPALDENRSKIAEVIKESIGK